MTEKNARAGMLVKVNEIPSENQIKQFMYFLDEGRNGSVMFSFIGNGYDSTSMKIMAGENNGPIFETKMSARKARGMIKSLVENGTFDIYTFPSMLRGYYAALTGTDDKRKVKRGVKIANKIVNRKFNGML